MFTIVKKRRKGEERWKREKEKRIREREREKTVILIYFFVVPSKISIYWAITVSSCNADCKLLENIAINKQSIFLKPQI